MEAKKYFQKLEIIPEDGFSIGDLVSHHYQLLEYLRELAQQLTIPALEQHDTLRIGLWYLNYRCRAISNYYHRESAAETAASVERMLECYLDIKQYYTPQAAALAPFDVERMMSEAAAKVEAVLRQPAIAATKEQELLVASFLEHVAWCRASKEMVGQNWFVRIW